MADEARDAVEKRAREHDNDEFTLQALRGAETKAFDAGMLHAAQKMCPEMCGNGQEPTLRDRKYWHITGAVNPRIWLECPASPILAELEKMK